MEHAQSPVRSQFASLRWRLLLSFLGVMAMTLGIGAVSVYRLVAHDLYQRFDRELLTLAEAAAYSFQRANNGSTVFNPQNPPDLDQDGDLDLAWDTLHRPSQGIEWFDANRQRLYKVGTTSVDFPLETIAYAHRIASLRVLTTPVYDANRLQGYIRVSMSTLQLDGELQRLQRGLARGSLIALGACGLGSWGLMRLAMKPIEESFERLRQFTADASHELRSPLAAMQTSLAVMQSHPERLQPADLHKVDLAANAARQMSRLVADLLLLARFDNATVQERFTPIPIEDLLEDLADLYDLRLASSTLRLQTDFKAQGMVCGEADQLKRLFTNLLDNAIKYTPALGTITFSSWRRNGDIVITLSDTGIGIAPDQLSRVYDRFWRADQARSHEGGSGLGLAIVKRIVQAHRGNITITSQLQQGSTVQVKLPLVKS